METCLHYLNVHMSQRALVKRITLGILVSAIYVGTGVLAGVVIGGCTNPVEDTYGKECIPLLR